MLYWEQGSADAAAAGRGARHPDHGVDKPVILAPANNHSDSVIVGYCSRGLEVADVHRPEIPPKSGDSNDGANFVFVFEILTRESHGCVQAGRSRRCLALLLTRIAVAKGVNRNLDQPPSARYEALCHNSRACHRSPPFRQRG